ncbi:MAG: hypothetical protein HY868_05910 [Chloroflexi bacterium]|nr:hypothetical protein [Chloroflexota bacterium]
MSEPVYSFDSETEEWQDDAAIAATSSLRQWINVLLVIALVVCIVSALIVPTALGYIVGHQELRDKSHEAAIEHFNRGLGLLAENYPETAYAEFEIALKYDETFEPARQKLRELQAQSGGPSASSTKQENQIAATLFDEATKLIAQKNWSDAITRLEQLRTLKTDYRAAEVKTLTYHAYVEGGKDAVKYGNIEIARERFESALALGNGDPEVVKQRDLAALYLEGKQAVGYNWQTAIQKFAAIYSRDPNYHDTKKQLFDAYVQYGDIAARTSPCLAAREYDSALVLTQDAQVAQKRMNSMNQCKQIIASPPTPTATTLVTGTVTTTTSVTATLIVPTENFAFKLSIATDKPCTTGAGDIAGVVRDLQGRPLANTLIGYYGEGFAVTTTRTNGNGQYQFVLGKDAGMLNVAVFATDGKTPIALVALVSYPGGNAPGCHVLLDWQRVQ